MRKASERAAQDEGSRSNEGDSKGITRMMLSKFRVKRSTLGAPSKQLAAALEPVNNRTRKTCDTLHTAPFFGRYFATWCRSPLHIAPRKWPTFGERGRCEGGARKD